MLTRLTISGLAIIDSLSIEFSQGFNVITGETGAGKSILIKALSMLLGAKPSGDSVRKGRESATVTGLFEVPEGHRSLEILTQYGLPSEKGAEGRMIIIVRRSVSNRGRSSAWINDVSVTASALRDLASTLIDVFGQHDNLRILDPSQHLSYVDLFLENPELLADYRSRYESSLQLFHEVRDLALWAANKTRDADYLKFRSNELDAFGPDIQDYESLQALCRQGSKSMELLRGLEKAQVLIDQGADGAPLSQRLWDLNRVLAHFQDINTNLIMFCDEANAIGQKLDDLSYQIGKEISSIDLDEREIEEAQTRLARYQELFRKLSVPDIDGLLAQYHRLKQELGQLETAERDLVTRMDQLKREVRETKALSEMLSTARQNARNLVRKQLIAELHELSMPEADVDVELLPTSRSTRELPLGGFSPAVRELWAKVQEDLAILGEWGAEKAQFLLATNRGESMLPLQKIASGGEISRVMLALKKALAAGADSCILVFDEIDSGISGRVADVVGRKMRELSQHFQVICISHLAQVAAYADTHFLVRKFDAGQRTQSMITPLEPKESEKEIARLLSGEDVTDSSLANAKALIGRARQSPKRTVGPRDRPPRKKSRNNALSRPVLSDHP